MAARAIASPNLLPNSSFFSLVGSSNRNEGFNINNGLGTLFHHQIHNLPTSFGSSTRDATSCKQCQGFEDVSNVDNVPQPTKLIEDPCFSADEGVSKPSKGKEMMMGEDGGDLEGKVKSFQALLIN
ncbi:putative cytochrome P450 [Corchorus olitorius]|uniref:Cytochrome P450 n=1 Tax=Corchorus olitorius TaxID=93759 RepID=A0A1R3KB43_9ROSI|nr:putative cytochrome P450 [Corchorus olitorius]